MDRKDLDKLRNLIYPIFYSDERIVNVWLFGSRARGDNKEDSDYDILLTCDPDAIDLTIGSSSLFYYKNELEKVLAKPVDIHELDSSLETNNPDFFRTVMEDRILLYNRDGFNQMEALKTDRNLIERERMLIREYSNECDEDKTVPPGLEALYSWYENKQANIPKFTYKAR